MIAAPSLVLVKKNIDMKERERERERERREREKNREGKDKKFSLSPFFSFLSSFL